ncbi:hypothetical protein AC579_8583 [Pseudocercospora musae]|uniref:SnoaL-like domain-containing protein n=1 Tax=Pseudocercospora musae TaxID=113226 RepID=A0A139IB69_9PEZI|nr:hypothetical protein AC579_8583 [Pseudocercospora musae]
MSASLVHVKDARPLTSLLFKNFGFMEDRQQHQLENQKNFNMDSRILEELAQLKAEVARLKAKDDINMLMGRHTINHVAKNIRNTVNFFALDEPDVSVEIGDRGVYRGRAAITTLFQDQFGSATLKGNLLFPFLTTGMVEVAGDGKSAKGTWRSPSVQAVMSEEGAEPIWLFGSYAVDFIKKEDGWKIWHFHWYRTIKCNHHKGWVEDQSWLFKGPLPKYVPSRVRQERYSELYPALRISNRQPTIIHILQTVSRIPSLVALHPMIVTMGRHGKIQTKPKCGNDY